jgi:hypothetical protein
VKTLNYLMAIAAFLLGLIGLEAALTMADAFNFKNYTIVGWIAQVCAVIVTVGTAICIVHNDYENDKKQF